MYEHLVCGKTLVHVPPRLDTHILHQSTGDAAKILSHRSSTGKGESYVSADFTKLLIYMDYLLHSLEIEIVLLAEALLGLLACIGSILMVDIQVGSKIPVLRIVEPAVCSSAEVLFPWGKEEWSLGREETHCDQDLLQDVWMIHHRFNNDTGVTREQGETAHQAADSGQLTLLINCPYEPECILCTGDSTMLWPGNEGKMLIVSYSQVTHT